MIMKEPQYTVDELIRILDSPKLGWYYRDINDRSNYFGGEGFKVLESNQLMNEAEKRGLIIGDMFISRDKSYEGKISTTFIEESAVAINCKDGVVIVPKISIYYVSGWRIEGYWFSKDKPYYQMPIPNRLNEDEAKQIYTLIKEKEKESKIVGSRGFSTSRLDNTVVGINEYHHDNWLWPEGYAEHYILKHKVKPSIEFLRFIGWQDDEDQRT